MVARAREQVLEAKKCEELKFTRSELLNIVADDKPKSNPFAYYLSEFKSEFFSDKEGKKLEESVFHPLIYYTEALVLIVNESSGKGDVERKMRYLDAAKMYWKAIQITEYNAMYFNNLGWILMKLTEFKVIKLPEDHPLLKEYSLNIPQLAEKMFEDSVDLDPDNRLVHANLCLLYSLDYFRTLDHERYFHYSIYYGEKAISIDPGYINGHRDLTVALIRYNDLSEAKKYYLKSLELADKPYKDREIMEDIIGHLKITKKLNEKGKAISQSLWKSMDTREQQSWENPDRKYFKPHKQK